MFQYKCTLMLYDELNQTKESRMELIVSGISLKHFCALHLQLTLQYNKCNGTYFHDFPLKFISWKLWCKLPIYDFKLVDDWWQFWFFFTFVTKYATSTMGKTVQSKKAQTSQITWREIECFAGVWMRHTRVLQVVRKCLCCLF